MERRLVAVPQTILDEVLAHIELTAPLPLISSEISLCNVGWLSTNIPDKIDGRIIMLPRLDMQFRGLATPDLTIRRRMN
jgi:hypothetical protein